MALTGYKDDSSSDGDKVEMSEKMNEKKGDCNTTDDGGVGDGLTASKLEEHNDCNTTDGAGEGLTASKLEEHNTKMGEEIHSQQPKSEVGAGILFGLSGLLLGGPILGLLTGFGAAYVATNNDGPAGNAARRSGDFAIETGSKVGEAAREANEKHHILDKIKDIFNNGWNRVQKFDEEHKIGEKAKESMSGVKQKTVEFEQKHHVMENILEGIQNGVNFLLDKLRDTTATNESSAAESEAEKSASS